jgi:hypothetical protein
MGFLFGWGLMGVLPSSPTLLPMLGEGSFIFLWCGGNIGFCWFYFIVL